MITNKPQFDAPTPVEISSTPIGFITCDKTLGNAIEATSMILYFAVACNISYFLLKENGRGDAYIVETGCFSKYGRDYNSRCIMSSTEYRFHIPDHVMRLMEYKPVEIRVREKIPV